MLQAYRTSSIEWNPSPVIALATSVDESQVAAAREDGSLEVWLVSPGSVGWHCQLTIHGDPQRRVSSLVWCRSRGMPSGRLFSSSFDGSVSEWDLFDLKQKIVLESNAVTIWQMAAAPCSIPEILPTKQAENGLLSHKANKADDDDDEESSESEDDDDKSVDIKEDSFSSNHHLAMARDDGCVQVYSFTESDELIYYKSLPRASGRALSVTWSPDASFLYSGSSDGFIRCWDAKLGHEIYRITVGLGGLGSGSELCIWALLALRCGTLVSGDSSGSVQFWDSKLGTLLQAHSLHKGDIHALAVAPTHNRVFSAGADGQVILYKLCSDTVGSSDDMASSVVMKKWVYVGYVRAHTHDVRALTVAVPICREAPLPNKSSKKARVMEKPNDFSYQKWAQLGVPMLISAGDDTKLFAYSAKEFSQFSPHDICPAPQRVPTQLVINTIFNKYSLLLVQGTFSLDILCVRIKGGSDLGMGYGPSGGRATTDLLARVKSKARKKIICSTISASGAFFAYSDHVKPNLFELAKTDGVKSVWTVNKRQLPRKLPYAHCMVFSPDCSWMMIAGHDRKIYVVDVQNSEVVHTFTPRRSEQAEELPPCEPPITKMFTSSDGQWLAAINCFGDIYIFNLEIQRQHWFISRLEGASVTAGGFPPDNNNVLIITTSLNQVYAFDVDAKKLGEWSMHHTYVLPRRYQEFPGEVTGLSFLPSSTSSSVIVYSARAMCLIDFGKPVDPEENVEMEPDIPSEKKLSSINALLKRKLKQQDIIKPKSHQRTNFDFCAFKDPVLFVGHLSNNSILVIEKPWMEVVRSFDSKPVHRHIYGT